MVSASRWNWADRPSSWPSSCVGGRADGAGPEVALLAGVAPVDVEPHGRPAAQPDRFAAGNQEWGFEPLGKGGHRAGGRAVGVVVALDQEGAACKPPLAVAERGQRLAVGRGGGQVFGPHRVQAKLEAGARRRRRPPACSTRPRRRARSPAGSARRPARPRARRPARPRRPATAAAPAAPRRAQRCEQPAEPRIEGGDAGEIMDNSLVDPQRGAAQRRAVAQLDQPPAPQGRGGRQRHSSGPRAGRPWPGRRSGMATHRPALPGSRRRNLRRARPRRRAAARRARTARGRRPRPAPRAPPGAGSAADASRMARSSSSAVGRSSAAAPPAAASTARRIVLRTRASDVSKYRLLASIQSVGMGDKPLRTTAIVKDHAATDPVLVMKRSSCDPHLPFGPRQRLRTGTSFAG